MVVDDIGQFPFEYDYLSEIGSRLFFDGEFEENEIRFFENRITQHPAPVILDIGANVGLHSVRWAMTSPRAKVYAFEPSYATYQILARNILRAGLQGRVEAFQQAVSDHVGVAQFYECADNAYSSLKDTGRKAVVGIPQVELNTIDEFVKGQELNRLSLIKIDVEGLETEVIKGSLNTLRRFAPELFAEIYGGVGSNANPGETIELMHSLGYQSYVLVNGVPVAYQTHRDEYYNYYFTHPESAQRQQLAQGTRRDK